MRNTRGRKIRFASEGNTGFVLMFLKASSVHFQQETCYRMVASRQVEIPYYNAVGRQRGRGHGALALVTWRTTVPILRKYVVAAAKLVVVDVIEFAAPKIAEVVSGRERLKSTAKKIWKTYFEKTIGSGS